MDLPLPLNKEDALTTSFRIYLPGVSPLSSKVGFKHCLGLASEIEVTALPAGGSFVPLSARGLQILHRVTFSGGLSSCGSTELMSWLEQTARAGEVVAKKTVAVYLEDSLLGIPLFGWRLTQSWPCRWELLPISQSETNAPALEELTFAFDQIETIRL